MNVLKVIYYTNYQIPCKGYLVYSFNGKEKDYESGFHYYGARYYNSELSVWLSTDPMADKYRSLTPYNYCANNPVKLIDPNGMEMWEPQITSGGKVSYVAEEGDTKNSFKEQYGLTQDQTDKIFAGMSSVVKGTRISGNKIKEVTGSDILKLNLSSKQATDERFVYHTMFGILHNKVKNNSDITNLSEYLTLTGNTGASNSMRLSGDFKIPLLDGKSMKLSFFNRTFSKQYPHVALGGVFDYNIDNTGKRSRQTYFQNYDSNIPRLMITMPIDDSDSFEKTYR